MGTLPTLVAAIASLALAGCPLQKSSTTTLGGPSSGGNPSSTGGGGGASGDPNAMATMPDLTGKTRDEAIAIVKAAGFRHEAEARPMMCDGPAQEVGTVDCQDPEPGKSVQAYTLVKFNLKEAERLTGMFLRRHFDGLKGLPVAAAKAKAKKDGHTGEIRMREVDRFVEGCKENTVCSATDEREGQSGMDSKDPLLLHTNKPAIKIAPPPED